jgi:hypothetical protein
MQVDNCSELQSLSLHSDRMTELNVSSLIQLSNLELLETPKLRQLSVAGCQALTQIQGLVMCTELESVDTCGTLLKEDCFQGCFLYGKKMMKIQRQQSPPPSDIYNDV